MATPIETTEGNYDDIVGRTDLTLVDYWAPWCGWCRRLAPVFEKLAEEYSGRVTFAKINVEEELDLARRGGVHALPTLTFLCGGRSVKEVQGFLPEQALRHAIDEALVACAAA